MYKSDMLYPHHCLFLLRHSKGWLLPKGWEAMGDDTSQQSRGFTSQGPVRQHRVSWASPLLPTRVKQESRTPAKFVVMRQVWGQAWRSIHSSGSGPAIARQVQSEPGKLVQGPGSTGSTSSSYSTAQGRGWAEMELLGHGQRLRVEAQVRLLSARKASQWPQGL